MMYHEILNISLNFFEIFDLYEKLFLILNIFFLEVYPSYGWFFLFF